MRPAARTTIAILGIAITSTLALVGCTEDEPGLTPLPTETTSAAETDHSSPGSLPTDPPFISEPPTSASVASDVGLAVAQAYVDIVNEIMNEHPEDASDIDLVAKGELADILKQTAQSYLDNGATRSGDDIFTPDVDTIAVGESANAPEIPYSKVAVGGCMDSTNVTATLSDGSEVPVSEQGVVAVDIEVTYSTDEGAWYVTDMTEHMGEFNC